MDLGLKQVGVGQLCVCVCGGGGVHLCPQLHGFIYLVKKISYDPTYW